MISWADHERDISAWLGNDMQRSAAEYAYSLEREVLSTHNPELVHAWRKMLTSDHFYYMCTKTLNDGEVHSYFNPFQSPYDAFVTYVNALNHLRQYIKNENTRQKALRHLNNNRYLRDTKAPSPITSSVAV